MQLGCVGRTEPGHFLAGALAEEHAVFPGQPNAGAERIGPWSTLGQADLARRAIWRNDRSARVLQVGEATVGADRLHRQRYLSAVGAQRRRWLKISTHRGWQRP